MRKTLLVACAAVLATAMGSAYAAGLPSSRNQDPAGPCGFPSLKKLSAALTLTHDEEQQILRIYNDYRHKEREEAQANKGPNGQPGKPSGDLRSAMINEVRACLAEDQKKKLDDALNTKKKK
jgi:hypothetical protein